MTGPAPVIFTDIDGTLIDFETYSTEETRQSVSQLVAQGIPIILCSSKTRQEQEHYRKIYGLPDPFIVENGSAIFIPRAYFSYKFPSHRQTDRYKIIELGKPASDIQSHLNTIREETGIGFRTYWDLPLPEICRLTGLSPEGAGAARQREYSATILTLLSSSERDRLAAAFRKVGLQLTPGGRFHTVTAAGTDKGDAVVRLAALFRRKFGEIATVGLGDSANDRALLAAVDRPYLVQKPDRSWEEIPGAERVPAIGPRGWSTIAGQILKSYHACDTPR